MLTLTNKSEKLHALITLARRDLLTFCQLIDPTWKPSKFHKHLCKKLQRMTLKQILRYIVGMPPQHGKSRLISQFLPAWLLGINPTLKVACCSYSATRSLDNSLKCRDLLKEPIYALIFPETKLREDSQAIDLWYVTGGGFYRAVGITGSLTGLPSDLIIIDDPIKDAEEAQSPGILDKIWDWYFTVARTRLSPNAKIIVLMTRWAVDDLIGRILKSGDKDSFLQLGIEPENWETFIYKAESEEDDIIGRRPGEFLWEEHYGKQWYLQNKVLNPFWWEAMFQQNPKLKGGNLIKTDLIKLIDKAQVPTGLRMARFWDLAVTDGQTSDYTAGVLGGLDTQGNFYILDVLRFRETWGIAKPKIIEQAKKDGCQQVVEAVAGFKIAFAELQQALIGHCTVVETRPKGGKEVNTTGWNSLTTAGKVYVVKAPWNLALFAEIADFPRGKHDDQVDAISGCYNKLKVSAVITNATY